MMSSYCIRGIVCGEDSYLRIREMIVPRSVLVYGQTPRRNLHSAPTLEVATPGKKTSLRCCLHNQDSTHKPASLAVHNRMQLTLYGTR